MRIRVNSNFPDNSRCQPNTPFVHTLKPSNMIKHSIAILTTILIFTGCSKEGHNANANYHIRTRFIQALTDKPLKASHVNIRKFLSDDCGGWRCAGVDTEYWGQLISDAEGYIDINEKGFYIFQSDEDSLWNPFLMENPLPPQSLLNRLEQTCYMVPICMLYLSVQKGQFQWGNVTIHTTGGMPHFANADLDQRSIPPTTSQETIVRLVKGVETQVKISITNTDGSNRDTLIRITPTTRDKIKITLPF